MYRKRLFGGKNETNVFEQDGIKMENKIYPDLYLEESYEEYDDLNTTIIRGFKTELDERMEEMKVFSPYMEILRRHRNKEGAVLPIPELCMAVLTFLL